MFNIPRDQANAVTAANRSGEGIRLPFAALHLWWKNGDNAYKSQDSKTKGTALYFGGWGATADEADTTLSEMGIDTLPAGFTERMNVSARSGNTYDAYFARYIVGAVVARRGKWQKDQQTGKVTSRVNLLVYLASHDRAKKVFEPWGFGILSASGYSGQALNDAVSEFERGTAAARKQYFSNADFKTGLPANYFYAPIGTFGDTPVRVPKGKPGQQSPITPAQVFIPKEISEKNITDWYVGDIIAAVMYDALLNSQEWLDDWNKAAPNKRETEQQTSEVQEYQNPADDMPF
jgi:hypothetical protein